jgi:hypothetical protein
MPALLTSPARPRSPTARATVSAAAIVAVGDVYDHRHQVKGACFERLTIISLRTPAKTLATLREVERGSTYARKCP